MRHWKQLLSGLCLLGLIGLSGCSDTEVTICTPDFDHTIQAQTIPVRISLQKAEELTGLSSLLCIPDRNNTRASSTDPVAFCYRVDTPVVLFEADSLQRLYPASVTKLLTAYVALKYGNPEDMVRISYQASHLNISGAMLCGFLEGDTLSLRELLSAMLLKSGNDAAIAVAEHISGSVTEFAKLMNQEMEQLGGFHSNFVNPHGLHDPNHYTTAYDMYLVLNALLQNDTALEILRQESCTVYYKDVSGVSKSKSFQNTNAFLAGKLACPEGLAILGGKTGTTTAAGCCLLQAFRTEDNRYYIAGVFGAEEEEQLYHSMLELMHLALEDA